uniref:Protein FAM33A n=1 Tax=Neogobius melanostomus TaxID=47308 RepID=A0A8C6S6G2_9GOBI
NEQTTDKINIFQKSEADLDYIEKRLKLDFINKTSESGCSAENPAVLLKKLTEIKAHHAALSSQVQELASDQRQTMDSIRANLEEAQKVLKELQDKAELQVNRYLSTSRSSYASFWLNTDLLWTNVLLRQHE